MTTTMLIIGLILGTVGSVYWILRCHHHPPLALLPPTLDLDGHRQPARWFCSDCGRSWPAGLSHDTAPIPRFTGYDQSKARVAAKRAEELADRHHELALRRAGLRPDPERRPRSASQRKEPVPIHGRRLAG